MGLVVLAGFALARPGMALDPQRRVSQYSQDTWRSDDGLPQNSLLAVTQTRDGYVWLGTYEGLARFDGARFTVFEKRNTPELRNHIVKALAEDAAGVLWVGTEQGLVAYREGRFERAPGAAAPLDGARVQELLVGDGVLWVGTSGGLWQVPLGEGVARQYTEAEGLPHPFVSALAPGEGGSLWVGTRAGLVKLANGRLEPAPFPFPGVDARPEVLALARDAEGMLWLGTNAGLFSWNGVLARRFGPEDGLPSYITALYTDSHGNLWVGSRHEGLVRHSAEGFSAPVPGEGLAKAEVLSVQEDRDGHLWVGTSSGLVRLRDGAFATWGPPEGLGDETVSAVLEDQRGVMWIGTLSGGLHRLEDGRLAQAGAAEGLPEKVISGLAEGPDGTLWVGTTHGLYRYDGKRFAPLRGPGLPRGLVTALFVDSRGDTWVASPKELARLRAGGGITVYGERQGVISPIIAIAEDPSGRMWFATAEAGVLRWEEGKGFHRFTQKDGLPGDVVLALLADKDGTVWVGTEMGLGRWRDGEWARFTVAQGLYDDAVFSLLPDGDGYLWMSSNKGVSRVSRRELDEVARGALPRLTVLGFDMRDGMRSAECNGNTQPSGWRGRNGELWFANLRGAIVVNPDRVPVRQPPRVVVEEVQVQGRPVPVTGPVELPPGVSRLDIRFTAFTDEDAKRLPFRYRLLGYDDDWVTTEVRSTTYTGLRPGHYTFEVQAGGRDSGWTQPVSLAVVQERELWQSPWFRVLFVLGTMAVGVSVYWLRVGQLKKRERWLAERVRERTQELARANQDLETNVRTLRQTQAQLVQAGRMAAVGQLAAGVGHEINNPLAYIVSNLEHASSEADALARELGDAKGVGPRLRDVSQALREALHGADRVRRIVRDLKTFSRPDDEKQGPVELQAVLDSAVKIAMGELRPRAKLVRDYGEVPHVEGNEARLAQVFLNLLINAAQALPEGRAEENEVRLVTRVTPDGSVVAEVRDTGTGIAPEALGRIFDPFFTTKPVGVGTGLGLSLCHAYVTAMGGTISVESELGRGSVFRVTLRRARDSGAVASPGWKERSSGSFPTVEPRAVGTEASQKGASRDVGVGTSQGNGASMPGRDVSGDGARRERMEAMAPALLAEPRGARPLDAPPPVARPEDARAPGAEAAVPRAAAACAPEQAPAAQEPTAQSPARGRVLVVDDDALVSGAIRRTLARENDVEVLVSARQALERLSAPELRYDVVLCDLMMPEMTGMDLYDALVKSSPRVAARVVFITGGAFTPAARTFLERVENPRVEKPFDPEALRVLIRAEVARVRAAASGRAA